MYSETTTVKQEKPEIQFCHSNQLCISCSTQTVCKYKFPCKTKVCSGGDVSATWL